MTKILLVDNDAILKLVACHFFWETVQILGIEQINIRVLPEAKYVFSYNQKIKQLYPESILKTAIEIVDICAKICPEFSEELTQLEIEGIDLGERALIVATKTLTN